MVPSVKRARCRWGLRCIGTAVYIEDVTELDCVDQVYCSASFVMLSVTLSNRHSLSFGCGVCSQTKEKRSLFICSSEEDVKEFCVGI